jgi:hypothetical protein
MNKATNSASIAGKAKEPNLTPIVWPDIVLAHNGIDDHIIFESTRSELTPPKDINL